MRGKTQIVNCNRCGDPFLARVADIKRGWGKFCSKSCKAIKQTYGRHAYKKSCGVARSQPASQKQEGV